MPPRDDAFVVNLGEMLQRMTGNYFVATTHRVIATEPRFSSGYFHGPDLRTPLEPLPLGAELAAAVAASPRHAGAGFMAKRHELLAGQGGTSSTSADVVRPAAVELLPAQLPGQRPRPLPRSRRVAPARSGVAWIA